MIYVLSVSGGKDSVAMWSWAKRENLTPRVVVYQDTGWEATKDGINHYEYLTLIETLFGEKIHRVSDPEGMRGKVRRKKMWPGRLKRRKYCTAELKIEPMAKFLDVLREESEDEVEVYVAVRREESAEREVMVEREHADIYDCDIVRPLLDWSLQDVIDEHHEFGIPIHPLYLAGAERVGCWPCVKAGKTELSLVGRIDPGRIDEIETIEKETGNTMFSLDEPTVNGIRGRSIPTGIREMARWAGTAYGGKKTGRYTSGQRGRGRATRRECLIREPAQEERGLPPWHSADSTVFYKSAACK